MTPAETELWQRIAAFSFDDPTATWPFSARLAKENRWTPEFAARAIAEYRRFAFLAAVNPEPVSPSDVVDQVWHEHLVYTRNYWEEFCAKTLQRRLHHEPTRGGANERAKFDDWYARTLETYRSHFGVPPIDIWPSPGERASEKVDRVSVDLSRHWIMPKLRRATIGWLAAACIPLAFLGCASIATDAYNPLDWTGPDFLRFWLPLTAGCIALATFLRWWLRTSTAHPITLTDSVDIALLAGGSTRVIQATVATLYRRGLLEVANGTLKTKSLLPPDASPVERRIFTSCSLADIARISSLREEIASDVAPRQQALIRAGLLVDNTTAWRIRLSAAACMAIPLLLGLAKLVVGLNRNRPVAFLVIGLIVTTITTLGLLRRPLRTRAGSAALDKLQ